MPTSSITTEDMTVADLLANFGPIAMVRIRQIPAPGTATEQDVVDIYEREKRLYELTDGVLVEKTVGTHEALLALYIGGLLAEFVRCRQLGFALGADGMARLVPGLVRIPDVSVVLWDQLPHRRVPRGPMLNFAPALAVEVLSPSNTRKEMDRKLRDYFAAGVRLVWYVDPNARKVQVFAAVDQAKTLEEQDTLTGEPLLKDFVLPLRELFAELER
jgi:Uma2 family endonuclease